MALPTKPTSRPTWTDANPSFAAEPTQSKKNVGWSTSERPSYQTMNWLFYNLGSSWLNYFEAITDQLKGLLSQYDAVVSATSSLANYTSLAAAVTATNSTPGARILVLDNQALGGTVQVTAINTEIQLKPGVVISNNGAGTGLQFSAAGCRIKGGKMSGFSTAAILIDAGATSCMVGEMRFASNTNDITDNSGVSATWGLINE